MEGISLAQTGRNIARWTGLKPVRSSENLGWRSAAIHKWRGNASECKFDQMADPMIVFHTGGARRVPVRLGSRWEHSTSHPGQLTIIPPGTALTWNVDGQVHSYTIHLGTGSFDRLVDADRPRLLDNLRFRCGEQDPILAGLISAMASELDGPSELGTLYVDAIADSIALHLLRAASHAPVACQASGGLSSLALRRTVERINGCVENGVSLQELADEVGLSRAHFAKAFRQSTGLTPHRFLINCRIDKARELLIGSSDALAEVALLCGFSSQAHFTETFRRITGYTPRDYRQRCS